MATSAPKASPASCWRTNSLYGLSSLSDWMTQSRYVPRRRSLAIHFIAMRLAESYQVQPVRRPAFTVMRTGKNPFDERLPRVVTFIRHERFDLLRCWRNPEHHEIQSSDLKHVAPQRATVSSRCLQVCRKRTRRYLCLGTLHRLKRPVRQIDFRLRWSVAFRSLCSVGNPLFDQFDLTLR